MSTTYDLRGQLLLVLSRVRNVDLLDDMIPGFAQSIAERLQNESTSALASVIKLVWENKTFGTTSGKIQASNNAIVACVSTKHGRY